MARGIRLKTYKPSIPLEDDILCEGLSLNPQMIQRMPLDSNGLPFFVDTTVQPPDSSLIPTRNPDGTPSGRESTLRRVIGRA